MNDMPRLVIGFLDPFQPFAWTHEGCAKGRFIDILRAAAARNNIAVAFRPGPLDVLPQWLARGEIDGIAAKAMVPGRALEFAFSEPLMQTSAALFGPAGTVPPPLGPDVKGRIATPASGPLVGLLGRCAPCARLITVRDYEAALAAVAEGRADWAALNADAGADIAAVWRNGAIRARGPTFGHIDLALAVSPGDPRGVLSALGLAPSPQVD